MSGIERSRKMELLHTPKAELVKLMRENSIDINEMVFLAASNKLTASDVRLHSPSTCDKMINIILRQAISKGSQDEQKKSGEIKVVEAASQIVV